MTEYLLLYFVSITKSRAEAETALVDFLASLKYYTGRQLRAKYFSKMCSFIYDD
jgi:hypothetical protein